MGGQLRAVGSRLTSYGASLVIPTGEATELTAERSAAVLASLFISRIQAESRSITTVVCARANGSQPAPQVGVGIGHCVSTSRYPQETPCK